MRSYEPTRVYTVAIVVWVKQYTRPILNKFAQNLHFRPEYYSNVRVQ